MADISLQSGHISWADTPSFYDKLNHQWHKPGLQVFMVIVLAHWAEHLAQAFQVYVLHWPIPASRGVLGLWFPWLVKSELLHYLYALLMIIGLWVFRRGFQGLSDQWWWACTSTCARRRARNPAVGVLAPGIREHLGSIPPEVRDRHGWTGKRGS